MYTVRKIWLPIRRENITSVAIAKIQKTITCQLSQKILSLKTSKGQELSNKSEKFVVRFFGGATTKRIESDI